MTLLLEITNGNISNPTSGQLSLGRYLSLYQGKAQADRYLNGLFEHFQSIADRTVFSKPIPAIFEVDGFVSRYEHHYVYWKYLDDGKVGIATVLHERMHQIERLEEDVTE